ncbi:hypothetical protein ABWH91_16030 [Phycisphaerales bacterium ac7]
MPGIGLGTGFGEQAHADQPEPDEQVRVRVGIDARDDRARDNEPVAEERLELADGLQVYPAVIAAHVVDIHHRRDRSGDLPAVVGESEAAGHGVCACTPKGADVIAPEILLDRAAPGVGDDDRVVLAALYATSERLD